MAVQIFLKVSPFPHEGSHSSVVCFVSNTDFCVYFFVKLWTVVQKKKKKAKI